MISRGKLSPVHFFSLTILAYSFCNSQGGGGNAGFTPTPLRCLFNQVCVQCILKAYCWGWAVLVCFFSSLIMGLVALKSTHSWVGNTHPTDKQEPSQECCGEQQFSSWGLWPPGQTRFKKIFALQSLTVVKWHLCSSKENNFMGGRGVPATWGIVLKGRSIRKVLRTIVLEAAWAGSLHPRTPWLNSLI